MRAPVIVRAILSAVLSALLCTACGAGAEPKEGSVDRSEQYATLAQRPDIDEAQAGYLALLETIRGELVAEFGIAAWQPASSTPPGSACGAEFSELGADGEIRRFTSGISPGNLPDDRWESAVSRVAATAAARGFGPPSTVVDRPGDHEVSLKDEHGAELLFGTAANTTLSLSTGCHLTKAAKERGTP
jgi:hypothetical protein